MDNVELILGDCLEIMPTLPAGSVDLILVDPPYGTTRCPWDEVIPYGKLWPEIRRLRKPNAATAIFAAGMFTAKTMVSNEAEYRYRWTWIKDNRTNFLNAKRQPLRVTEDVVIFYEKQPTYNPQMTQGEPYTIKNGIDGANVYGAYKQVTTENTGTRYPIDALEIPGERPRVHPTQKPTALLRYLIETYTNPGDLVLDFTAGSGSTAVACIETGRRCIAIELDPKSYEQAAKRIEQAAAK